MTAFGECSPTELTTFGGSIGYETPEEALEANLEGEPIPDASTFERRSPQSGDLAEWDIVHSSGVVVGRITGFETQDGWYIEIGEWCAE